MKNRFSFIAVYCLLFLMGVLGLSVLILGNHDGGASETENRTLAGLPEMNVTDIADGTFSNGTEAYLSDQMFARDRLLDLSSDVLSVFSRVTTREALMQVDVDSLIAGEGDAADYATEDTPAVSAAANSTTTPLPQDAQEPAETPTDDAVTEHAEEGVYSFSLRNTSGGFTRVYTFSEESITQTAATLNAYRAALPDDGQVFFTYVPYSQVADRWLLDRERYCGWVSDVEAALQTHVDPGVHVYSAVNELEPHMRDGEHVFFLTDHHWTPLGAYYLTEKMIEGSGIPSTRYNDYSYCIHQHFRGSIYSQANEMSQGDVDEQLEQLYPLAPTRTFRYRMLDELIRELVFIDYSCAAYGSLLGSMQRPWQLISTGFHTGRNALIIGDSTFWAFAPYLTTYYDTVCMCDLRKDTFWESGGASVREYIEHYDIDDVYFIMATGVGINSSHMKERVLRALG